MNDSITAQLRITAPRNEARDITRGLCEGLIGRGSITETVLGQQLRDNPESFRFTHDTTKVAAAVAPHVQLSNRAAVIETLDEYCGSRYVFTGKIQSYDTTTSIDIDVSVDSTKLAIDAANAYALAHLAKKAQVRPATEIIAHHERVNRLKEFWGVSHALVAKSRALDPPQLQVLATQKTTHVEEAYCYVGAGLLRTLWWLTQDYVPQDRTHFRLEARPSPGDSRVVPRDVMNSLIGEDEYVEGSLMYARQQAVIGAAVIPKRWWRPEIAFPDYATN